MKVFFILTILLISQALFGQQPTLVIDTTGVCNESTINVHLRGKFLSNIGAMTLFIRYPSETLTFKSIINVNSQIKGLISNSLTNPACISLVWSGTTGVSFPNTVMLDLQFDVKVPSGILSFAIDSCEIADATIPPQILSIQYINGTVIDKKPVVLINPGNKFVPPGSNCTFITNAQNVNGYHWQESRDNGSTWSFMENASAITGTHTNQLQLTNVSVSSSNFQYRCEIKMDSCVVFSQPALLKVDKIYRIEEKEELDNQLTFYPNPACEYIILEWFNKESYFLNAEIFSQNGYSVGKSVFFFKESGIQKIKLNIVYLQVGLYTCKYTISGKREILRGQFKFIKYQ